MNDLFYNLLCPSATPWMRLNTSYCIFKILEGSSWIIWIYFLNQLCLIFKCFRLLHFATYVCCNACIIYICIVVCVSNVFFIRRHVIISKLAASPLAQMVFFKHKGLTISFFRKRHTPNKFTLMKHKIFDKSEIHNSSIHLGFNQWYNSYEIQQLVDQPLEK